MTPEEVRMHFKTGYNFRKKTGMSDNTMHNWINAGYIPFASQKKIEKITEGILIAEWHEQELIAREPK